MAAFLTAGAALAADQISPPLVNWTAPRTFSAHGASRGASTLGDTTGALPFVAITPCRQYDSRNFTPLPQNTSRAVQLRGAPCGVPSSAVAFSVNITIFSISATANGVFQVGTATGPTFAWINFPPTETQRGNAGSLPVDGSGNLWVRVLMGSGQLDFVVDVNGYYPSYNINPGEAFGIIGNASGGGIVYGQNDNSAAFPTSGVRGVITSTGDDAAGVLGQATATTGRVHGVGGTTASTTDDADGVIGSALATTGKVFGVKGTTVSTSVIAAGVKGIASEAAANAGAFRNQGAGTATFLGSQASGINYDLAGNARIQAGSLDIVGSPKNFVAPHPLDPSKEIKYACVEAPTVDVYFRGTATLSSGYARIEVPDHFRFTAREGTYMTTLTPVGRPNSLSVESEGPEGIVVRGIGNASFHYVVYAERAEIEGYEPVQKNVTFTPEFMEKIHLLKALPASTKALLIRNGTLNPDGTYNLATARAMGWTIPKPAADETATPR